MSRATGPDIINDSPVFAAEAAGVTTRYDNVGDLYTALNANPAAVMLLGGRFPTDLAILLDNPVRGSGAWLNGLQIGLYIPGASRQRVLLRELNLRGRCVIVKQNDTTNDSTVHLDGFTFHESGWLSLFALLTSTSKLTRVLLTNCRGFNTTNASTSESGSGGSIVWQGRDDTSQVMLLTIGRGCYFESTVGAIFGGYAHSQSRVYLEDDAVVLPAPGAALSTVTVGNAGPLHTDLVFDNRPMVVRKPVVGEETYAWTATGPGTADWLPVVSSGLTPLVAPSGGQASAVSDSIMSVNTGTSNGATGYKLYRSTTSNGTFTQIGGTLSSTSYNDTGLSAATTYYYKSQALGNGTTTSNSPLSAVFSGATQNSSGLVSVMPADAKWFDGNYKLPLGGGFIRNTGSSVKSSSAVTATLLRFLLVSNYNLIGLNVDYIGLKVNGVFQRVQFAANGAVQTVDVTIASGSTVEIITHDLARNGPGTANVCGAALVDLQANVSFAWATPTAPAHRYLVLSDSIGGGNVATEPLTQGWPFLVRDAWAGNNTRVTVESFSGGSLVDIYGQSVASGTKQALITRLVAALDGTATNTVLPTLGINDQGLGTATPAQYKAAYAALLDDLHAAKPDLRIAPITGTFVTGGGDGAQETYRQQVRDVCNNRSYVYKLLEGPKMVSAANINNTPNDHVHPLTPGQAEYASNVLANFTPTTTGILADYAYASAVFDPATGGVFGWRDNSTNAGNLVNDPANPTPMRTGGNIAFDGNGFMPIQSVPAIVVNQNNAFTIFQVVSIPNNAGPTHLSASLYATDNARIGLGLLNSSNGLRYGLTTYTGAVSGTATPLTKLVTLKLVSANIRPATPDNFQLYINGDLQADASTPTLGNNGNPSSDNHAVRIPNGGLEVGGPLGLLWYGNLNHTRVCTLLSDAERQAMEAELIALYNL